MKSSTKLIPLPQSLPEKATQTEPAASTGLTRRPECLPTKTDTLSVPALPIADFACKPLPEFEAELALGLDRILELGELDPLASLDAMIGVMLGLNAEIVKTLAPTLVENFQLLGAEFKASGTLVKTARAESRGLVSLQRTQETIIKLGAARVKVRDELNRRQRGRGEAEGVSTERRTE